jgi:hypothetical protein
MQMLLSSWHVASPAVAARRPKIDIYNAAGLLIGIAVTTVAWLAGLALLLYAVGIDASGFVFASAGAGIAAMSAIGLAIIMAPR